MGLLTWIAIGAIAGWLAGQVIKGSGFGLIGDIVVGVIGAVIGDSPQPTMGHGARRVVEQNDCHTERWTTSSWNDYGGR
jgi:uncharacterized membrane protein YeaQ/YmgE (transglycosylase-associated protein family)